MALSWTAVTSWDTQGDSAGGNSSYKDVTVSCAAGDLLVAYGGGASQNEATGTNGSVTTQSGTTSAWTQAATPDPVLDSDAASTCAWATVTSGTSVTVRITVATYLKMGGGVWVIPAAEWDSGTSPVFTAVGPADADAKQAVTISNTSTVLLGMVDWAAVNPTEALTPSGGTAHAKSYTGTDYAWVAASWTGQSSGTDYGLTGATGRDYAGSVIVVKEDSGTPATVTPTAVAATASVGGDYATRNATVVMGGASKQGVWT